LVSRKVMENIPLENMLKHKKNNKVIWNMKLVFTKGKLDLTNLTTYEDVTGSVDEMTAVAVFSPLTIPRLFTVTQSNLTIKLLKQGFNRCMEYWLTCQAPRVAASGMKSHLAPSP